MAGDDNPHVGPKRICVVRPEDMEEADHGWLAVLGLARRIAREEGREEPSEEDIAEARTRYNEEHG